MAAAAGRKSPWDDSWIEDWKRDGLEVDHSSRFARLARGNSPRRRRRRGKISVRKLRLIEIERLIRDRYHGPLPQDQEKESGAFILAAAFALNALNPGDFERDLAGWCHRWAPWALSRAGTVLRPIINELRGRRHDLGADEVARLLGVTLGESRIDRAKPFRTIGACDVPEKVRKANAKLRKMKRDRDRAAKIRRKQGRRPWSESLSRLQPWLAEGISRRTWERRRKSQPDAKVSRIGTEYLMSSDTFASPSKLDAMVTILADASKGSPSSPGEIGADCSSRGTGRADVEEERVAMGVASPLRHVPEARRCAK